MSKNLVIVESPEKARTIEHFLGNEYHVLPSKGHVRDIEGVGKNSMGIDLQHGYEPNYVMEESKARLIQTLRSEAQKADTVWLASDEDREGEAIAWHLKEVLNLPEEKTKRIVFHEITKTAILNAIEHPRDIDYNLVNAQQARRVMDRIVGFELSPVLWRKITTGLSAGRVQSVAVRLIVEREREIEGFKTSAAYRVAADFIGKNAQGEEVLIKTELNHRFATKEEAQAFLEEFGKMSYSVRDVQRKPGTKSPAPPFTTSTLQQEAARKLRFPVAKTMRVAQSLYEAGKITYMRTDSVNLSSLAIATAREEVVDLYGANYHKARNFKTSSKGAQEAHEAIRPTYLSHRTITGTTDEKNLYELIWKRAIASQMADAKVETTRVEVACEGSPYLFVASGEVVLFDGFMRAYVQSTDDENVQSAHLLPQVEAGLQLKAKEIVAQETYSKAPQRYTEASLVKKMEELGIGRPSTYATIIETIQQRHYVERGNVQGKKQEYNVLTLKNGKLTDKQKTEILGADMGKLLPTDLGRATNDYLVDEFPAILNYDFTAKAEADFDKIADGKANWVKVVDKFYQPFHKMVESVTPGKLESRLLGTDPATGKPVYAKIGKTGPLIQLGSTESDEKPRFTSLQKGQSIYTITLEEALQLFEHALPYVLGEKDGKEITIGKGKFGPYVRYDGEFVSIPKGIDPQHITIEEVEELLNQKADAATPLLEFGDIRVMNGRYGAYLKVGDANYKLPRGTKVDTLTKEQCEEIIKNSENAPKKSSFRRKK
ncbi:MAG: type I DNA topoisomerase [Paludibacteraceae bacterium]|nr:type I DNA topoisomerase [Paludibacteraceae bacterium]